MNILDIINKLDSFILYLTIVFITYFLKIILAIVLVTFAAIAIYMFFEDVIN